MWFLEFSEVGKEPCFEFWLVFRIPLKLVEKRFSLYRLVFGGFGGALRGLDLVAEHAGCLDPAWILFPADTAAVFEFRRVVASFGEFLCDFGNFLNLV